MNSCFFMLASKPAHLFYGYMSKPNFSALKYSKRSINMTAQWCISLDLNSHTRQRKTIQVWSLWVPWTREDSTWHTSSTLLYLLALSVICYSPNSDIYLENKFTFIDKAWRGNRLNQTKYWSLYKNKII